MVGEEKLSDVDAVVDSVVLEHFRVLVSVIRDVPRLSKGCLAKSPPDHYLYHYHPQCRHVAALALPIYVVEIVLNSLQFCVREVYVPPSAAW